jgi:micrococcal nuclease
LLPRRQAATQGGRRVEVLGITDGDTIRVAGLGRVRLIGVDTPEVFGGRECFEPEASAFVKRTLHQGDHVRLRVGEEARDRYGRTLAYVRLPDGRSLNELLVKRGYARTLTIAPNTALAPRLRRLERSAQRARHGLWAACPSQ